MSMSRRPSSHRQYWCHECNTNVQSVEGLDDPMCSRCHGSFLEEVRSSTLAPLPSLPLAFPFLAGPTPSAPSVVNAPSSPRTPGASPMTECPAPSHCVLAYPIAVPQPLGQIQAQQLEEDQQVPEDLVEDMHQPFPTLFSHLFASLYGGLPPRSRTPPTSAGSTSSSASATGQQQLDGPDILLARLMHMALHPRQHPQPSAPGPGSSVQQPQGQRTTTPMPGGFQSSFQTVFTFPPPPSSSSASSSGGDPRSGPSPAGMSTPPLPPFLATLFSGLGLPLNAQGGFNFGDFVFSQEQMDRIAEQLGQQGPQPQQQGMPADFFATGLPDVDIIEAQVVKGLECVICQDKYSVGEAGVCKVGSCDHMFHRECVEPWLKKNHTCPTCRWDVLAEWKASKEGRDRVRWVEAPESSSRSRGSGDTSGSGRGAAGQQEEKTPGSWEPEIEPLD